MDKTNDKERLGCNIDRCRFPTSRSSWMLRLPQEYHPHLSKENPLNIGTIERLINKKKLEEKVVFKNRFVLNEELHTYILAAEMIVLPYVDGT